jgi:tryptophanyl-tRNA synthetase
MTYVISQAADILFVSPDPDVSRTTILVPVGDDQVPHLQDTNKIAKAFNNQYGDTLVTCDSLVGDVGRLVGTDGQDKMSKSLGNTIFLSDDTATVEKQVMGMFTDPERIRADIPGTVKGNPVFIYHDAFNPDVEEVKDLKARYKQGKVGDVEVKEKLIVALENFLGPIRAKRHLAESVNVIGILSDGTGKARELAIQTVARVKKSMGLVRLEG